MCLLKKSTFDVDYELELTTISLWGYNLTDYRVGILDEETGDINYLKVLTKHLDI